MYVSRNVLLRFVEHWPRAARGLLPGKGDEPSAPTQLLCAALDWSGLSDLNPEF
jgi:hypothetical protein